MHKSGCFTKLCWECGKALFRFATCVSAFFFFFCTALHILDRKTTDMLPKLALGVFLGQNKDGNLLLNARRSGKHEIHEDINKYA